MKATELRIGNYVSYIGNETRVTVISDGFVSTLKSAPLTYNQVAPIPLTEEWLLKMGAIHVFNSTRATDTSYRYGRFNLTYKKAYKYWYVTDSESDVYLSKVEFVHEWQNFVFAMDGEELEAKP